MKKAVPYLMIGSTLGLAVLAINELMTTPFLSQSNKKTVILVSAALAVGTTVAHHV